MARKIKWRLQFKSLNGTGCLVNIYEEGYSSQADTAKTGADVPFAVETGVTELIGAAVPFEYQEDDSNNLLEVIRIKTAYLRVVEVNKHDLDDLFPTSIRHHFVEAFYGNERVFTGYMQCQEFDNAWVANPRELEFACVSPLGLLDAFNFAVPQNHGLVTLGTLMQEVMIGLNPSADSANVSDYQNVIYPVNSAEYVPWNYKINSTVIVPFNSDFKHYDFDIYDQPIDLWSPNTYQYFLEGLCKCFGWIAHDTPAGVVFTMYEYGGSYQQLSVAGLTSLSGVVWLQQLDTQFELYYENTDDNAEQTVVMPVKKVTLQLEGTDISKKELTTEHTTSKDWMQGWNMYRSVSLVQVGPDVTADHIGKANIGLANGDLNNKGTFPLAYGKIEENSVSVSLDESWVIKYDASWPNGTNLITAKMFGNPPRSSDGWCIMKLAVERGSSLQNMQTSGHDEIALNLVIRIDGKYLMISNNTLYPDITYNAITINRQTGKVNPNCSFNNLPSGASARDVGDIDGIIFNIGYSVAGVVEVGLYKSGSTALNDGEILRISDLALDDPGHIDEKYYSYYNKRSEIVVGNNNTGTEVCDISVPFNNYSSYRGENSVCRPDNYVSGDPPTYPYMFLPLHVLTERVKRTSTAISFNEYAAKWKYWINGWRWRMIAKTFNLRDDEYTITLARSSTIQA